MVIDPENSDRLILGTERLGIQVSDNGGQTYRASNQGFSHRRIVDAAVDPQHPERALVVLTSNFEPLLETNDAGRTWTPLATGLKSGPPRHVFASPDGWFAAPGPGGLLRYDASKSSWVPVNQVTEKSAPAQTRRDRFREEGICAELENFGSEIGGEFRSTRRDKINGSVSCQSE